MSHLNHWDIAFIVGAAFWLVRLARAYIGGEPMQRFDDEATDYAPESPTLPVGYVESERERFQRESYVQRHEPKQITNPSLVNAILAEHNEARRKDGKIG